MSEKARDKLRKAGRGFEKLGRGIGKDLGSSIEKEESDGSEKKSKKITELAEKISSLSDGEREQLRELLAKNENRGQK